MTWFDIVPMNICYMLLDHPWFDANKVGYNNVLHIYSFIFGYKKYNLHACTRIAFLKKALKSLCTLKGESYFQVFQP